MCVQHDYDSHKTTNCSRHRDIQGDEEAWQMRWSLALAVSADGFGGARTTGGAGGPPTGSPEDPSRRLRRRTVRTDVAQHRLIIYLYSPNNNIY